MSGKRAPGPFFITGWTVTPWEFTLEELKAAERFPCADDHCDNGVRARGDYCVMCHHTGAAQIMATCETCGTEEWVGVAAPGVDSAYRLLRCSSCPPGDDGDTTKT